MTACVASGSHTPRIEPEPNALLYSPFFFFLASGESSSVSLPFFCVRIRWHYYDSTVLKLFFFSYSAFFCNIAPNLQSNSNHVIFSEKSIFRRRKWCSQSRKRKTSSRTSSLGFLNTLDWVSGFSWGARSGKEKIWEERWAYNPDATRNSVLVVV